jgi:FtsH-binding integral membrane protein
MLLTAVVAFLTVNTPLLGLALNPVILIIAIVAEFGVVLGISFGLKRLSPGAATLLFFVYAALNGFTLSLIVLAFSNSSLFLAFGSTAALFAAMSIIGYTTHVDLTKMGTYLMMGLIGLLIAMVVNLFLNSGPLDMVISIIGILVFTALTAFDTQRIGRMAAEMSVGSDEAVKFGIFGALKLYLDFINMFLYILRLFGRRR